MYPIARISNQESLLYTERRWTAICDGPFTTFCDGVTRAMCSPATPMLVETRRMAEGLLSISTGTMTRPPFVLPSPTCIIPSVGYTRLWEDYIDWFTTQPDRGW